MTLTGDRAGEYLVVDERPDGALVIVPNPHPAPRATSGPARAPGAAVAPGGSAAAPQAPPGTFGGLLSGLLSGRRQRPTTVPGALAEWGVALTEDELIRAFVVVDVDGRGGFVAVTTERFLFVPQTGAGTGSGLEHRLSTLRGVELVREHWREKLRITWDESETIVSGPRQALSDLRGRLEVS